MWCAKARAPKSSPDCAQTESALFLRAKAQGTRGIQRVGPDGRVEAIHEGEIETKRELGIGGNSRVAGSARVAAFPPSFVSFVINGIKYNFVITIFYFIQNIYE